MHIHQIRPALSYVYNTLIVRPNPVGGKPGPLLTIELSLTVTAEKTVDSTDPD